jgi:hypothetical protein
MKASTASSILIMVLLTAAVVGMAQDARIG